MCVWVCVLVSVWGDDQSVVTTTTTTTSMWCPSLWSSWSTKRGRKKQSRANEQLVQVCVCGWVASVVVSGQQPKRIMQRKEWKNVTSTTEAPAARETRAAAPERSKRMCWWVSQLMCAPTTDKDERERFIKQRENEWETQVTRRHESWRLVSQSGQCVLKRPLYNN